MKLLNNQFLRGLLAVSTLVLNTLPVNAATAVAGKYKIDANHSTILFTASHLGFSNLTGRFNKFKGDFNLDSKGNSKVELSIETGSIDTNHAKRDTHLRSPDFFNAKQFPLMRFVSTKVNFNKNGEPVEIKGTLTLHGKTNPVTLSVKPIGAGKDPWGGIRAGYDAKTVIKRSAYGMKFMPGGIGDEVEITLNIEAIKQ